MHSTTERPNGSANGQFIEADGELRFVPAMPSILAKSREGFADWLRTSSSLDATRHDDAILVFAELMANAINAAGEHDIVSYSFDNAEDEVVVRVLNPNPQQSVVEFRSMPDPFATEGRGLALAQAFADRIDLHNIGGVVDVSAHFAHQPPSGALTVTDEH